MDIDQLWLTAKEMEKSSPDNHTTDLKPIDYTGNDNDADETASVGSVPQPTQAEVAYQMVPTITSKYGLYLMIAGSVVYGFSDRDPWWITGAGALFSAGLYQTLVKTKMN